MTAWFPAAAASLVRSPGSLVRILSPGAARPRSRRGLAGRQAEFMLGPGDLLKGEHAVL
jgi:hypothetical protein